MPRTDDAFTTLDGWLRGAILALDPRHRQTLLRQIARDLRRSNQKRITAQTGPDGDRWQSRKPDAAGRIKTRKKMLIGLRAARHMAVTATPNRADLGYKGRSSRIARIHHLGLTGEVTPGGVVVKYPARPLIGLSGRDEDMVRDRVLLAFADLPGD
jgi:phage virion morphogenesis protein